jgi:hypothetical protein
MLSLVGFSLCRLHVSITNSIIYSNRVVKGDATPSFSNHFTSKSVVSMSTSNEYKAVFEDWNQFMISLRSQATHIVVGSWQCRFVDFFS